MRGMMPIYRSSMQHFVDQCIGYVNKKEKLIPMHVSGFGLDSDE